MEVNQVERGKISTFYGRNFEGQITIKEDTVRMEITQFKKRNLYFIEINNNIIQKYAQNYLIFKKTSDLFEQLIDNKLLEINDEGCLIAPMSVGLKGKTFEIKIIIPLQMIKFVNQEEEKHKLYEIIARMQKEKLEYLNTQLKRLNFKGDSNNANYKFFDISKDGKQIKMIGCGWGNYTNFNHYQTLPKFGVFSFKFKIIKTQKKCIFVGICAKQIKEQVNCQRNQYFIGLNFSDEKIYSNTIIKNGTSAIEVSEGKSVFKLEIDMNKRILKWSMNDQQLCEENINENLVDKQIYPLISLYHEGDIIEFVN